MRYKDVTRAIILDLDGRVLLAQRASGRNKGEWALIGGKPEGEEETPAQTIIREVAEEAGLTYKPTLFKEEVDPDQTDQDLSWRVYYFYGPAVGEIVLAAEENSAARYFEHAELETLPVALGHRRILDEFFDSPAAQAV